MKKLGVSLRDGKPFVPGSDFSGIIHAAGKDARWTVGQEVHGMKMNMDGGSPVASCSIPAILTVSGNGTLQQYLKIPSSAAISPKPTTMSWTEAAAIPLVYSTVYGALVETAQLPFTPSAEEKDKRSVLILGGSSGTGNVAIQLAKKMGLRVVTTCSSRNRDFVTGLGADEVSPADHIDGRMS